MRAYIVPTPSAGRHQHLSSLNPNSGYQKLLQRRQDLCNSAKKPLEITTFDQTITFIEQLKRNQHRPLTDLNRSLVQAPYENNNERKTLTPRELCSQLNIKLENLIRTQAIGRHRVINRTTILPTTPIKPRIMPSITPRESFNQTTFSDLCPSRQKNVFSSSTTATNTIIFHDDLVDKDSFEDNDEVFEEMMEEENITFLQLQRQ